jgi:Putative cyclase
MTSQQPANTDGKPQFQDLPFLPDSEERHAWDVWGREDQIGSVNWIGAEQVRGASALVKHGRVVNLTSPLNQPAPGLHVRRTSYEHVMIRTSHGRDDKIDGLYPQFSSQWDGLRHVKYRQHGYWGGRQDEQVDDAEELGIENWTRHGLIGRGVLLDVKQHVEAHGRRLQPNVREPITPALLDEVAAAEGVELQQGDLLVIRTGWMEWFSSLTPEQRGDLQGTIGRQPDPLACPGLDGHRETAEWLWNHRIAAVAADNPALEVLPVDRAAGFLHYRLIPLLGLAIGEFWDVQELSSACRELESYAFMLASAVLHIPGGVGSPANAYAIL